jgi:arginase family enzyme
LDNFTEIFAGYLEPVINNFQDYYPARYKHSLFADNIIHYTPEANILHDFTKFDIALLGVPEDRHSYSQGCNLAPDFIRKELYRLFCPYKMPGILELGNLKTGKKPEDTYFALLEITKALLTEGIVLIIIGGGQDLTYPLFLAFEQLKRTINITCIDSKIDIGDVSGEICSDSFISRIILQQSNSLFNFSGIGYQNYLVPQSELALTDKLFFDTFRLGTVRSDIYSVEPILRDTHLLSFDISSVRQSDAPGQNHPSPNGLFAEEACLLARFGGIGDNCSVFGLFEVNPDHDRQSQTIRLSAQIIWHFIEGVSERKKGFDRHDSSKYIVKLEGIKQEITFYRCKKTDRWWLEIPYIKGKEEKIITIACSSKDYEISCQGDIPDRLWKVYQKL